MKEFKPNDWVVYRKQKFSASPGPRAKNVSAPKHGDTYSYVVDKYWVIKQRLDDNSLLLVTRTGKEHVVDADDPRLRLAKWWERWLLADRFRGEDQLAGGDE